MLSGTRWTNYRVLGLGVVLGAVIFVIGCGGGPSLTPVKGKVTINGKALTSGTVTYKPDKAKGNTFGGEPMGEINSSGEYTLQTKGKPGAPLGAYKVCVSSTGPVTQDNTKPSSQSPVNMTYMLAETTPLEKTVTDKPAANYYDLPLGP